MVLSRGELAKCDGKTFTMKVIIFCPVVIESAIARMSALVVEALLSQGHEVIVVRSESEKCQTEKIHHFATKIISWQTLDKYSGIIQDADEVIYHVGNHYSFHEGCIYWMQIMPGIICLHDFFLVHLFMGYASSNREKAEHILKFWYGSENAELFFTLSAESLIDQTKDVMPMTEWVCSMARGVVIHSNWGADRVMKSCPGPVSLIPLAYDVKNLSKNLPKNNKKIHILTVGHINPNKRVDKIIEAIGANSFLKDKVIYEIVGQITENENLYLKELAGKYKVSISILGVVNEIALNELFLKADIVCCLRYPALEAASASAIESMLYAKPTICSDTGFYSEIPKGLIIKINPLKDEVKQISKAIKFLCLNLDQAKLMGKNAQRWARKTFRADNYARSIIKMANLTIKVSPVIEAMEKISTIRNNWYKIDTSTTKISSDSIKKLQIFNGEMNEN
jgi:glycosyltransferase involved in cell wall biosynthesis